MQRSRIIIVSSLALLLVVVLVGMLMSGKDGSPQSKTSESEVGAAAPEFVGAETEGASEVRPGESPHVTLAPSSSSSSSSSSKDTKASSTEPATNSAKTSDTKSEAPCQIVDLKSDVAETKGHLHEFRLERALAASEPLCVTVDGKSVSHTRLKDGRVRIDWKIAKASSKVSAQFCTEGIKCKVTCPEPEKDFWDSIGSDDAALVGTGFADADAAEDRELQKEIKALKDVLNRKPAEAPIAKWTVVARHDSSCK